MHDIARLTISADVEQTEEAVDTIDGMALCPLCSKQVHYR
jgi:hypothetical protein